MAVKSKKSSDLAPEANSEMVKKTVYLTRQTNGALLRHCADVMASTGAYVSASTLIEEAIKRHLLHITRKQGA